MRSLPPPRRSKARAFRRFLHRLYRILTLQFFLKSKKGVMIRKRRTPFHFTSRRYKVKLPKRRRTGYRWFRKNRPGIPVSQIELGEGGADLDANPLSRIQFRSMGRRRSYISRLDRRYVRRLVKKVVYKMYAPRRHRRMNDLNIVVDV